MMNRNRRNVLWLVGFLLLFFGALLWQIARQRRNSSEESSSEASHPQDFDLPNDALSSTLAVERWLIEGTETPILICIQKEGRQSSEQCRSAVESQQARVWNHIQDLLLPNTPVERIAHHQKLVNLLTIEVHTSHSDNMTIQSLQKLFSSIDGVHTAKRQIETEIPLMQQLTQAQAAAAIGANNAIREEPFCVQGAGIRVAVIDTGIDYTHSLVGGSGDTADYAAAYTDPTTLNAPFPIGSVVDGFDFTGEGGVPDEDPIDAPQGHGTSVATCVLAVAPQAQLLAVKACSGTSCSSLAIIDALEYSVDPNGDDDVSDKAHVINISLGREYLGAYFSEVSLAVQNAFALGATVVLAAGNSGNIPYILGAMAGSSNAITVGATNTAGGLTPASFTSRGPGDFGNEIKPELSAPGVGLVAALASTGTFTALLSGTSFSAPLVAGAAALLIERCPTCSPFAIKCILVNTVSRNIDQSLDRDALLSPISLTGSGQANVANALATDFWAYSVEDVQPTISLGVVNVAEDMTIARTLRVVNLSEEDDFITLSTVFRDPSDATAMSITFSQQSAAIDSACNSELTLSVTFNIVAANVPTNHMTGGGAAAHETDRLDINEFDGWIVMTSTITGKQVTLPFHSILRKAAQLAVGTTILPALQSWPVNDFELNMVNSGVGPAQVDVYELVHISTDAPENAIGSNSPHADFRYIGYRATAQPNCGFLLEFAFVLWEEKRTPYNTELSVLFFNQNDGSQRVILATTGPNQEDTAYTECRYQFQSGPDNSWQCAGFSPDHTTNSVTITSKVCTDDLGLSSEETLPLLFFSLTIPSTGIVEQSPVYIVDLPSSVATPSFDVAPGQTWETLPLERSPGTQQGSNPKGLLLVTDAYRNAGSTGASVEGSEAFALVFPGTSVPNEVTPRVLAKPPVTDFTGPGCTEWKSTFQICPTRRILLPESELPFHHEGIAGMFNLSPEPRRLNNDICPERDLDLLDSLLTQNPTSAPVTSSPTISFHPSTAPSIFPTLTTVPSLRPTSSPRPSLSPTTTNSPSASMEPSMIPTISQSPSRDRQFPGFIPNLTSRPSGTASSSGKSPAGGDSMMMKVMLACATSTILVLLV